jgi:hypothetical protein
MDKALEQKFYDRWPEWFRGRHEGMRTNLMCFGFDHGDGWFDLEWRLCQDIETILDVDSPKYKLFQVKEKFGTLRWYDGLGEDAAPEKSVAVAKRITEAEKESARTCEVCGKPGHIGTRYGWVSVRCNECKGEGWVAYEREEGD